MTYAAVRARSFCRSRSILKSLLIISLLAIASIAQDVPKTGSLSTDKLDYQPGDIVTITGENWAPGETVTMVVGEDPQVHPDRTLVAVADENGNFKNTDLAIEQDHLGVHFLLAATGDSSGYSTSIQFFDGEGAKTSGTAQDYTISKSASGNSITHDGAAQTQLAFTASSGNQVLPINLPFAFRMYSTTYAAGAPMAVSINGVIQFGSNLTSSNNSSITDAPFSNALLAYWDNLGLQRSSPNGVFWSVSGTAPNRVLNVEWRQMQMGGGSNPPIVSFEARLYEGSNKVEFIYGPGPAASVYGGGATIGVLETKNTHYTQHSFDTAGTVGQGVKLTLTPGTPVLSDTTPPVITVPSSIVEEATSGAGAVVSYTVSATDNTDGTITPTCAPASGSTFPLGTTTVHCSATDAAGNGSTESFSVTVQDTTDPTITISPALTSGVLTVEATAIHTTVNFTATASDIVDSDVPVSCSPDSGSNFSVGSTDVDCSATDDAGNVGSLKFSVKVEDTIPPVLTLPQDITKEATGAQGAAVTFTASALDLGEAVDVLCTPASGSTFALGTTKVECKAEDAAGNVQTGSFNVLVQDTTPPELTVPANITAEATGPNGAAVAFTVSAQDLVDGTVTPECDATSGATFALGTHTVKCTAKDAAGNTSAEKSFTITVRDTTPPALTVPGNIVAEATSPAGAVVTFSTSAADIVDGAVTPDCDAISGATFALAVRTVTCTAKDAAGNASAAKTFTITVQDTTAPVLALPGNITEVATGALGNVITFSATATDIVDVTVPVTCSRASGSTFLGTTTVTCTATDQHNNAASGNFIVTVTFGWSGFLQPINLDGSSAFKLGSTVPVKFQLGGVSAGISNLVAKIYVAKVSNSVVGAELEAISTSAATTGNLFRYDPIAQQYIFNWGTKGQSLGTYQIRADFGDGVQRTVLVSLR